MINFTVTLHYLKKHGVQYIFFSQFFYVAYHQHHILFFLLQIIRDVEAHDMTLTAVALSHSGKMLFAGTAAGTLRSMKFPLTVPGDWNEYQGHHSPVSKVNKFNIIIRISHMTKYVPMVLKS